MELVYEECSVNDIISECVELLSSELERKEIRCQLNLDAAISRAYIDKDIFAQIVTGLILSAAHEMDDGGTLELKTFSSGENIHTEYRYPCSTAKAKGGQHVFMPFDESYHRIGLPLSRRLLRHMGGFLSFSQEQDDMTLTVSLPNRLERVSFMDRNTTL